MLYPVVYHSRADFELFRGLFYCQLAGVSQLRCGDAVFVSDPFDHGRIERLALCSGDSMRVQRRGNVRVLVVAGKFSNGLYYVVLVVQTFVDGGGISTVRSSLSPPCQRMCSTT